MLKLKWTPRNIYFSTTPRNSYTRRFWIALRKALGNNRGQIFLEDSEINITNLMQRSTVFQKKVIQSKEKKRN